MRSLFFLLLFSLSAFGQTKHLATVFDVDACDRIGVWIQTTSDASVRTYTQANIAGIRCVDLEGHAEAYRFLSNEVVSVSILDQAAGQWFVSVSKEGDDVAEYLIARGLAFALPLPMAQAELLDVATVARYHAAQTEAKNAKKGIWHYGDDVDPFAFKSFQAPPRPNSPALPNLPARPQKANTGQFKSKKRP